MPTKVKELDNLREGDRHNCVLCCPSKRMVPEDKVWEFANKTGLYPWVEGQPALSGLAKGLGLG